LGFGFCVGLREHTAGENMQQKMEEGCCLGTSILAMLPTSMGSIPIINKTIPKRKKNKKASFLAY
jgi:hypothetical protein